MYIFDRLFSESSPEEVYYSVAMTEEEYSLYSEFIEDLYSDGEDDGLRTAGKVGLGAAGLAGVGALGNAAVSGWHFKKATEGQKIPFEDIKKGYKEGMEMSYKDIFKGRKDLLDNGIKRYRPENVTKGLHSYDAITHAKIAKHAGIAALGLGAAGGAAYLLGGKKQGQ